MTATLTQIMIVSAMVLSWCGGCANERQAARQALPSSYPASADNWDHRIDHVDFVTRIDLARYQKVVVAQVDTTAVKLPPRDDNTYEPTTNVLARATDLLANGIRGKLNGIISVEAESSTAPTPSAGALLVRAKITELNPGSQAARWWVGFGAGASTSAFQGEIVDADGGQTLVKFQNAKNRSMGTFGGGYTELLTDEVVTAGQDIGVLLEAFAPPAK